MDQPLQLEDLSPAIQASLENGDRLVEDARWLLDLERYPTAFALSILAQEEYAKAFLLHLVKAGAIPWTVEVRRTLRDHTCKQLLALIMDFLQPDWDDFLVKLTAQRKTLPFPSHIADALNIVRHEKAVEYKDSDWLWDDTKPCDPKARKIADGNVDREKQNALYVGIGKTGQLVSTPLLIDVERAEAEYKRTANLGQMFSRKDAKVSPVLSLEYEMVFEAFRLLFGLTSVEEYNKHWWAK
jgi:AbiV family abortive infection protein